MLSLLSGRRGQIESVHTRKTTMTKDKETQYERTGQIQQREISGHDLLSRFEEYRKKRKKGTEKPHEGKLDLPQGRRVSCQPRPLHRLRAGRHPPCGRPAKQHRQLLLPHAVRHAWKASLHFDAPIIPGQRPRVKKKSACQTGKTVLCCHNACAPLVYRLFTNRLQPPRRRCVCKDSADDRAEHFPGGSCI